VIERYQGVDGIRRLVAALGEDRLVAHDYVLASRLVADGVLREVRPGEVVIRQGDHTSDIFFIISGSFTVSVNGKTIAQRFSGTTVGEMSAVEPAQARAATVTAHEEAVLLELSEAAFTGIAGDYPDVWRRLAASLARRLAERNHLVTSPRPRVKVFIMSSVEALPIVDLLIEQFAHDPFLPIAWKNGVFKASNYTLEDLEAHIDDADFAVALAHQDDIVITRGDEWPAVRDNVIFELGMFMGRLGRRRAFLMEPRDGNLRLPSDLSGLTTIPYRYEPGADSAHLIAPACATLRRLILASGAKE